MKYVFAIICCMGLLGFTAHCASKYGIKKVWLFSQQQFAGIVRVDENGNPTSKGHWQTHFLYLEVNKNNTITWDSVLYQNKTYPITTTQVADNKVEVGTVAEKKSLDTIIITPKNNHTLLLLKIESTNIVFDENKQQLILYGQKEGEKISYEINEKSIFLTPEQRY
jgi:hypothetical protein